MCANVTSPRAWLQAPGPAWRTVTCREEGRDDIFNFLLIARLGSIFTAEVKALGEAVWDPEC